MMAYMELATYLGMAAEMVKGAMNSMDPEEDTAIIEKVHRALIESQLVMAKQGINQLIDTLDENGKEHLK